MAAGEPLRKPLGEAEDRGDAEAKPLPLCVRDAAPDAHALPEPPSASEPRAALRLGTGEVDAGALYVALALRCGEREAEVVLEAEAEGAGEAVGEGLGGKEARRREARGVRVDREVAEEKGVGMEEGDGSCSARAPPRRSGCGRGGAPPSGAQRSAPPPSPPSATKKGSPMAAAPRGQATPIGSSARAAPSTTSVCTAPDWSTRRSSAGAPRASPASPRAPGTPATLRGAQRGTATEQPAASVEAPQP